MPCAELTSNNDTFRAAFLPFVSLKQGEQSAPRKWESIEKFQIRQNTKFILKPEDFVWLELSMVGEVERVFVERHGNAFQVMTVVNDRSPELRRRIFAREKAIIDQLSQFEFDFDILTRMNQPLTDLVTTTDKPSYKR